MFNFLKRWWVKPGLSEEEYVREREKILLTAPIPVFWLFGKTGSGKSSIIRFITGAEQAEIGNGFRPQTMTSSEYDFPSPEEPVVKFLDTRGLGEARYDPTDDLKSFNQLAHVVIVTARVMDHALEDIVVPLKQIRSANPARRVLLALTCLHEAYPGKQHPTNDPYRESNTPAGIPDDLRRSIELQQQRFQGLVDRIVPIDLTRPEEGFQQPNFGGDRLEESLIEFLPEAYRQTLRQMQDANQSLRDLNERRALPHILGACTMAATAAAVPLPWVDIPAVVGIQTHLVYKLAGLYGQPMNSELLAKLGGAVGGRLLTRMAIREPLKLIPVLGSTANAAMAFAYTFSLGKACCWYFGQVQQGHLPTKEELDRVWNGQISGALDLWRRHRLEGKGATDSKN